MSGDRTSPRFEMIASTRRRWRREQKLAIVAEIDAPGGSVSEVARRHALHTSLLFRWRRDLRSARDLRPRRRRRASCRCGCRRLRAGAACACAAGHHRDGARRRADGARRRRCRHGRAGAHRRGAGGAPMIPVPAGVRVWLATGHTDMRKGFASSPCWCRRSWRRTRTRVTCSCSAAGAAISSR